MPLHRSRIKFRGVEYIESSGVDEDGSGVITWSREGHKPQVMDYFDETKLPESLEEAKERIKGFLRDDRARTDSEGYGHNPTDPTNKPTGNMPDLDGPGSP